MNIDVSTSVKERNNYLLNFSTSIRTSKFIAVSFFFFSIPSYQLFGIHLYIAVYIRMHTSVHIKARLSEVENCETEVNNIDLKMIIPLLCRKAFRCA